MRRIKQALCRQFFLQLLKGHRQISGPLWGHGHTVELIDAIPGINGNAPCGLHHHSVFRTKPQAHGAGAEHHTFQLRLTVLQRKIVMSRRVFFIVTEFSANTEPSQKAVGVQHLFDVAVDLTDLQYKLFILHDHSPQAM